MGEGIRMTQTIYCPECEAACSELDPTCPLCGHQLQEIHHKVHEPTAIELAAVAVKSMAATTKTAAAHVAHELGDSKPVARVKRTLSRKSRAIIAACNLLAAVILATVYFSYSSTVAPTTTTLLEEETIRREEETLAWMRAVRARIDAEGYSLEHFDMLNIMSAVMTRKNAYTHSDGSRISIREAWGKIVGGASHFNRLDLPGYIIEWRLSLGGQSFLKVQRDGSWNFSMKQIVTGELMDHTTLLHSPPEFMMTLFRTVTEADRELDRMKSAGPPNEFTGQYLATASARVADYAVEVSIRDAVADPLGGPWCRVLVEFTHASSGIDHPMGLFRTGIWILKGVDP